MTGTPTTVTLLFTDIQGSTRQWEEAPGMSSQVDEHFGVLCAAVEASGGEVFATMGDGVAAAFRSAGAALRAAIAAQHEMPTTGLRVRMGLHTGEVERRDDDYRGRPVNRAARIMAAGHGGQILLSDVTARLVATGPQPIELLDLGVHHLRDLAEPERLWQVVHPALERDFPPVRGLETFSSNLPVQRSSLVGREADVARLGRLVAEHRMVTATGAGGVGKTRLAIHAAADLLARFDKVWFVELAGVSDDAEVGDAVAATLGDAGAPDALDAIARIVGTARTLIVVDNCEHVIDGVADVVDALLARCAGLHTLATSREPLGIDGEHVVAVRSLDSDAAAELFRQRSHAAGAEPHDGAELILQICRRLDGIPLAIELAAAQTATIGLAEIAAALDDRFVSMSGGRRRAVDRHSTMRSAIGWSYRLLPPTERRLFEWLGVFSGGFELDAACAVAASCELPTSEALEAVAALVRKSMVVAEPGPGGLRYRMLETVRAFALERLVERDELGPAADAHAAWVASITDVCADDPCAAAAQQASRRLERDADNWREAVGHASRHGLAALGARLCGPPAAFFLLGRHDLSGLVRSLLDHLADGEPRQRRAVLTACVLSSAGISRLDHEVAVWVDEVRAIDGDDPTGLGGLLAWFTLAWRGEIEASVRVCIDELNDPRLPIASRDLFVGIAVHDRYGLTDAIDPDGLVDRAAEVVARRGPGVQRVACLLGLAWAAAATDAERALALVRTALGELDDVPPLMRRTLPGSASRLLTRLDQRSAARALLDELEAVAPGSSPPDLLPILHAAALLLRVGHPIGGAALRTLVTTPLAPYLRMLGLADDAERQPLDAALPFAALRPAMRDALQTIAAEGAA
jgi:predicted ATPase/class 3 adenylate cyclase